MGQEVDPLGSGIAGGEVERHLARHSRVFGHSDQQSRADPLATGLWHDSDRRPERIEVRRMDVHPTGCGESD